ncbi:glycosyltransferase family 2 protein [Iodidimonas sp. SYSU 1G8]|uniref:glycosyltransferase family 2 protein n=1 Tax=Iodidimonas sp. SYSU 1G8 TaxID=3133967 RepID=UPI0031FF1349
MSDLPEPRIAVLVPCYNEGVSIGAVVRDFRAALPQARIFIYDNNSTDDTVAVARAAGAIVRREPLQGKGNVVRRMFGDIEADIYVLVDGDDTYDAASAPRLVAELLDDRLDMVVGARVAEAKAAYRPGHRLGNVVLTRLVGLIFGNRFRDMLSGYRVFSRRFVKSFPALSHGFEIETELNVHALELRMNIREVDTPYRERPEGSFSKLSTFRDGWRILRMIVNLMKEERPREFFGLGFLLLFLTSLGFGVPVIAEFMETGLVRRFPTALLATGLMLLAFLSLTSGMILDTVTTARREVKRLAYLSQIAPGRPDEG